MRNSLEWRDKMNPFAYYRAINTKLHGKRRTLLSPKEWEKVTEFKAVPQVIDFLKKRESYKKIVADYKIEDLHRADLEIILDRYIVKEIETMLHYFSGSYKEFFKTFLMEYEINDLQLILRTIARKENMENIEQLFVHSEKYGLANYNKLLSCKSVGQFIEALKGTVYYDALKTITQDDLTKREFHMEMKLYILFYKRLLEKADQLSSNDKVIAKKVIGTKADLINIQWIFRATKYYDITPEEIIIYCLPSENKLTYQKLKTLSYSKNIDEFKNLVEKYLSYELFSQEDDVFLERTIDKYIYDYVVRNNNDGENIFASLAYIYILNIEIKDLVALIEGIRYTLPENELKKYLVHTI